jgi:hypothetical protein
LEVPLHAVVMAEQVPLAVVSGQAALRADFTHVYAFMVPQPVSDCMHATAACATPPRRFGAALEQYIAC